MALRRASVKPDAILASAPVRADLAGGTLDLWPLGVLEPDGATVAVAVSLRVEVEAARPRRKGEITLASRDLDRMLDAASGAAVRRGPLELLQRIARLAPDGVALTSFSPVRAGSGLGTSSALGIAAAAAAARLRGERPRPGEIVPLVRDLEAQVLGIPTGTQDHEAALRGGLVTLRYRAGAVDVAADQGNVLAALAERFVLADSGEGRSSGPSNWDMYRRRIEGDRDAVRALRRVARAGAKAARALADGDWRALGRAMREDLEARQEWSPLVLTGKLAGIFAAAREAGALGWKVCGAGGGGFAVLLAAPERRLAVSRAVAEAGGRPADARPTARGLQLAPRKRA